MPSFRQGFSLSHAEVPALHGTVVGRCTAPVVVVAGIHEVDAVPHGLRIAAAAFAVRVIQVGNAESMRVLMAERADGGQRRVGRVVVVQHQLGGAGVVVHDDPIAREVDAGAVLDVPHVRPYIFLSGALRLVGAGKEDEDVVHLAVAIVVIDGQVPVRVHLRAGVDDELGGVLVLVVVIVGPVVFVVLRQGDDGGDIELEVAPVLPLVLEIGDGGIGSVPVHLFLEILPREGEFQVLELGEDDESVAQRPSAPFREETPRTGPFPGLYGYQAVQPKVTLPGQKVPGNLPARGDHFAGRIGGSGMDPRILALPVIVETGVAPPSLRVLGKDAAVRGCREMTVLVAGKVGLDGGSVRLGEVHKAPAGRGGLYKKGAGKQIYDERPAPQSAGFRFHTLQSTAIFCAFARVYAKNRPQRVETDSLTCTKT